MNNFKVNFMLIGAMKCGTSTLAHILKNHPDIGFCKIKEPHFFSRTKNWNLHINEYHDLFNYKEGKIFGEASTSYTRYPSNNLGIWNDIYDYNSKMKFLYLVRNPVDRAISHYMHSYERGFTNKTFEKSVKNSIIINTGRYFTQLKPFINKFGLENFLIIDFDDLINDRTNVLKDISSFLNIDFNKFNDHERVHQNISVGGTKKSINHTRAIEFFNRYKLMSVVDLVPKKLKVKIIELFFNNSNRKFNEKPEFTEKYRKMIINLNTLDIDALEKITNKDFSKWKTLSN